MTTEVTIDEETTAQLEEAAASERISFDEALDRAIRVGATRIRLGFDRKPFRVRTHSFGDPMEDPKAILAQLQEEDDLEKLRRSGG